MKELHGYGLERGNVWLPVAITILASTVGLAGTDLLLPGLPLLAAAMPGSPVDAQLVVASYVAGLGLGLIVLGELGERYSVRLVLPVALLAFGCVSLLATSLETLRELAILRVLQGVFGAAGAVFAPAVIAEAFSRERAIRAMGMLGAFESLVPGFAPIVGLWIILAFGWQATFSVLGAASLCLALCALLCWREMPGPSEHRGGVGYLKLLRNGRFLGWASAHALALAALLSLVFAAPASFDLIVADGERPFLLMQAAGVSTFFVVSMSAGWISERIGFARTVHAGSMLMLGSAVAMLALHLSGTTAGWAFVAAFIPMNVGLGLRGPTGFYAAISEAPRDPSRASAVVLVLSLIVAALAAAAGAPLIESGFLAPAAISIVLMLAVAGLNARLLK